MRVERVQTKISAVWSAPYCPSASICQFNLLLAAEVLLVFGLAQPKTLARLLARRPAGRLRAIPPPAAGARCAGEELPAAQASTSSGLDHTLWDLPDPDHDQKCRLARGRMRLRGESHRHNHANRCRYSIVVSIAPHTPDAITIRLEQYSRPAGITVQVALETATTMNRNNHL